MKNTDNMENSLLIKNVLLDGEGKIVAYDLRGERLSEKLKEIYGF